MEAVLSQINDLTNMKSVAELGSTDLRVLCTYLKNFYTEKKVELDGELKQIALAGMARLGVIRAAHIAFKTREKPQFFESLPLNIAHDVGDELEWVAERLKTMRDVNYDFLKVYDKAKPHFNKLHEAILILSNSFTKLGNPDLAKNVPAMTEFRKRAIEYFKEVENSADKRLKDAADRLLVYEFHIENTKALIGYGDYFVTLPLQVGNQAHSLEPAPPLLESSAFLLEVSDTELLNRIGLFFCSFSAALKVLSSVKEKVNQVEVDVQQSLASVKTELACIEALFLKSQPLLDALA